MSDNIDYSALKWIKKELDITLKDAGVALEKYVEENIEDELDVVAKGFHQVYGTLQIVEIYGASLLLEEMELVIAGLKSGEIKQKDDAVEVVSRAIIQIPDYLERLQSGHKDIPIVLLPLMNDLRAVRGAGFMSESALFSPDMTSLEKLSEVSYSPGDGNQNFPKLAKSLRHAFHKGLLGWFRNQNPEENLKRINDVMSTLESSSKIELTKKLWWLCRGLVESLLIKGIKPSTAVKQLLGHTDRQIKRVIEGGESVLANEPDWDFIKNVLYYIAQTKRVNNRIQTIRQTFSLENALPSEDEILSAQENFSAPNADLIRSVTTAIKEELSGVKDNLDMFVRGGMTKESLAELMEPLRKVSDTLGMLGQGALRKRIVQQVDQLKTYSEDDIDPSEDNIMDVASELLIVEASLDTLLTSDGDVNDDSGEIDPDDISNIEKSGVLEAVLHEVAIDLNKAKDAIAIFLEDNSDFSVLDGVTEYFEHIHGVFFMLEYDRADALLVATMAFINQDLIEKNQAPDHKKSEALADAITSIDYYIEAVRENRSNRSHILDVAQQSLSELGHTVLGVFASEESENDNEIDIENVELGEIDGLTLTGDIDDADDNEEMSLEMDQSDEIELVDEIQPAEQSGNILEQKAEVMAVVPEAVAPASQSKLLDDVDEEILEIFIEEAQENLEMIQQDYPNWKINPNDADALSNFRRAFHTIKGSGRMVNATFISEVAWSVENMLNRIIDETIDHSPSLIAFMDDVLETLPLLVQALVDNVDPEIDTQRLIDWGDQLSKGEQPEPPEKAIEQSVEKQVEVNEPEIESPLEIDVTDIEEVVDEIELPEIEELIAVEDISLPTEMDDEVVEEAAQDQIDMDPVLFEIFNKESVTHLKVIQDYIVTVRNSKKPQLMDDKIRRAFHTLHGSAHMANVTGMALLSRSLEQFTKTLVGKKGAVSSETIDVIDKGVSHVEDMLFSLSKNDVPMPSAKTLISEIDEYHEKIKLEPVEQIEIDEQDSAINEELDDELLEIFLEEGLDIIDVIESTLGQWSGGSADTEIIEELQRSLHTLKGGARLSGLTGIGDLSHALESLLVSVVNDASENTKELIDLIHEAVDELANMIDFVGRRQALPDVAGLIKHLEEMTSGDALVDDTLMDGDHSDDQVVEDEAITIGEIASDDVPELVEEIEVAIDEPLVDADIELVEVNDEISHSDDEFDDEIVEAIEVEDIEIPEVIETEVTEDAIVEPVTEPVAVVDEHDEPIIELVDDDHIVTAIDENNIEELSVDDIDQDEEELSADDVLEIDEELLDIFLEEGQELIDTIETTLTEWKNDYHNTECMTQLQRSLHTLKGGARLSGLPAIGDLSHIMESMFTAINDGDLTVNDSVVEITHRVGDELANMVDCVAKHKNVIPATELIEKVEKLIENTDSGEDVAMAEEQISSPESMKHHVESEENKARSVNDAISEMSMVQEMSVLSAVEKEEREVRSATDRRSNSRGEKGAKRGGAQEQVRVRADLLDGLVNYAGEVSIYRARLEQQNGSFRFNISELDQTVTRLREQLRRLEMETEAQVLYNHGQEEQKRDDDFDPLEMDRYSTVQQLSRALNESVSDLVSIMDMMDNLTRESETLLLQQSRVVTELQEGLMRTRMVPFSSMVPRMNRLIRQTCNQLDKKAELAVVGAEGEMDRTILDGMIAPLEHMIRNAISHGIETPEQRRSVGKSEKGTITLHLSREGTDIVLMVSDDGGGIPIEIVKNKAIKLGLLRDDEDISTEDVLQCILESGFSTAGEVTQIAGRGVGMDVVNNEIKQLGGTLEITSEENKGTNFTVRLPFTLAINQALLVQVGEEVYAVPHSSIDGVVRLSKTELEKCYATEAPEYEYAGQKYQVQHICNLLGVPQTPLSDLKGRWAPILLVRSGQHRVALQVDGLMGNREIVVKSVGSQLSTVRWISGATILGDGRVVLILDVSALVRVGSVFHVAGEVQVAEPEPQQEKVHVMVVDDSITVRKVTTRLLERHNMLVSTAKDGVDAVAKLQDEVPDVMLLDIEMPRMDGYELAQHIRNNERLMGIPIIMITSRTGEKHRQRAMDIGVNSYLGKPYQESELMENINSLLNIEQEDD